MKTNFTFYQSTKYDQRPILPRWPLEKTALESLAELSDRLEVSHHIFK